MREKGYTLVEITVALAIVGFIAVLAGRILPEIIDQSKAVDMGYQVKAAASSALNTARYEGYLETPNNFERNFTYHNEYRDYYGKPVGYLTSVDTSQNLCELLTAKQKISLLYCADVGCRNVRERVDNVAALFYSNDLAFKERLEITTAAGAPLDRANYNTASLVLVKVKPGKEEGDSFVAEYTFRDLWELLGCATPKAQTTDNVIHTVRPLEDDNDHFNFNDYASVPINFLHLPGVQYCFEYVNKETKHPKATSNNLSLMGFRRDRGEGPGLCVLGTDAKGIVGNIVGIPARERSTYAFPLEDIISFVDDCADPYRSLWYDAGEEYLRDWLFCEDWKVQLAPGLSGWNNTRTFKVHARLPQDNSVITQTFTIIVRAGDGDLYE